MPVGPRVEECVPRSCDLTSDFKVEKPSSVPGRCEPMSRYICSMMEGNLERVKKDCHWENKEVVIQTPREDITTHVKGSQRQCCHEAAPPGEENATKSAKDKKRKRVPPFDTLKPKKSKACKSKNDTAALPADVVQKLRDEEEEEDADYKLAVTLHREAIFKSRAELNRCEADLKRFKEERDALKLISGQKEEEIKDLRAELAKAHKEQTDLIEQVRQKAEKIEQLRDEAKMKKAENFRWKQNMDRLASEKDTARAQFGSVSTPKHEGRELGPSQEN
ncbi:uncharacterized protein [Nicotiana sylvestris]|uniref:uncharacterized protein n=1 Tax=Nicotiana sylvestris TaxID=4096 RepID=UPI00388CD485